MWLITNFGFFSLVEKTDQKGNNELTIRTRTKGDLERLRDRYIPSISGIRAGVGTDYKYRAVASRDDIANGFRQAIGDISYENFKNSVYAKQGLERSHLYTELSSVLRKLQQEDKSNPPKKKVWPNKSKSVHNLPSHLHSDLPANVSCGGVVFDERKRVLLRKPAGEFDGYVWTFPKGKRNKGESLEQAAVRETHEEGGAEVELIRRIPGAFKGGTGITIYFEMKLIKEHGDFNRKETEQIAWVDVEEAKQMIQKTRNIIGRKRDLAVLHAAVSSINTLTLGIMSRWFDAIEQDALAVIEDLLSKYGSQLLNVGKVLEDRTAQSPLHIAAHYRAIQVLIYLLLAGVDPNQCIGNVATESGYVTEMTRLPKVLITPLDWAAHAGHEDVVEILLRHEAHPNGATPVDAGVVSDDDGFPDPVSCPLSRAVRLSFETKDQHRGLKSTRICKRLLLAGATPNRLMSVNRWVGTPLAFAWRILGNRDLCDLLLSHGAELFTDDLRSIGGAIRQEVEPFKIAMIRRITSGLLDVNKRYRWGVALSAFAIYTDAWANRQKIIELFLRANADPTLVFNHTLFGHGNLEYATIKTLHLNALACLLNAIARPDRKWASGRSLWDAWEESHFPRSLSKGALLFAMARDPSVKHVGFDAVSTIQQKVLSMVQQKRNFNDKGAWGYVMYLGANNWPRKKSQTFAIVAQFLHDASDTLLLWIYNTNDKVKYERVAERRVSVASVSEQIIGELIAELQSAVD